MTEKLQDLARGFRKRTLVTAKMAGKVGLKMARRTLGGPGEEKQVDAVAAAQAARELALSLGVLKGLVMKVGQMASYLPGALPEEAQRVLATLQAESTAMAYERVAEVIEEELGREPDALFESFDHEPFAAASIGQVHRARLDGRDVAVKVQYPGIEEVLSSDLSTFGWVAKISTLGLPVDASALHEELSSRILEECDYELEATNQRELAGLLAAYPDCHVPEVIAERSSRRVLTTELVDAMRFADFVDSAPQSAKDRAGEVIFRSCMGTLFGHGVYNGDPHPGNYLFDPDGRVTFLDFGCVRRFDAGFIETWKTFARGVIDDEEDRFAEWLLLNRLQWGLNAVLAKRNATAPWPRHFRAAVESGFAPPGEQLVAAPA